VPPTLKRATRVATSTQSYQVRPGDSLWDIAREFDTSVDRIQAENDLRGARIYAGQVLRVPAQTRQQ